MIECIVLKEFKSNYNLYQFYNKMISNSFRALRRTGLTYQPRYGLLDHKEMEDLKKKMFAEGKTWKMKLKFLLKESKYTLVQGSKDLWADLQWFTKLYRRKQKQYFTGFEMAQSRRIAVDLLKFVPYSVIILVPFAQLSLPIILWLFPNAIPSFYLFDTAEDQRIERAEQKQYESHQYLVDKLIAVMQTRFKLQPMEFSRYQFFKEDYFQIIDELDQHLDIQKFNSDQLIKVLEFLGGGFVTGTASLNKIVNLFTLNIPRLIIKVLRFFYSKLFRVQLKPYKDPWFVRGDFEVCKLNFFPFENIKRAFLMWQINRRFRQIWEQDRAFEQFGMDDVIGRKIKDLARERGLAALSCYETLKNVVKNDWVKFTTHPKFKNNNVKLWYSVMMYNFMKESSRDIN